MALTSQHLTLRGLILVFFCLPMTVFSQESQSLYLHKVSNISTGALCNDGTPAIYYLHNNMNSSKWMIYLEGGGGCNSESDCRDRFKKTPYFMSSKSYPKEIRTKTIMSDEEFGDYNKVILVYCSSDLWLGNDLIPTTNLATKNKTGTTKKATFVFRGAVIFSTILMELLSKGLANATDVMLIGQSAGGIGAINHLDFISSVLPKDTCKLTLVLDSAWFIDFENYFRNQFGEGFGKTTGILERPSCRDISWGFPCCFSIFCMMSNSYLPPDIPIFLMQSKYDIYVLFQRLLQQNKHLDNVLQSNDILLKVHSYGGRMQQSLDIVDSRPNLNYISTSCFQHGYLVSSTLWDTVYKREIELNFPSVRFKHVMNDSYWSEIKIGNQSVKNIFMSWFRKDRNRNGTFASFADQSSIKINDICSHAQCNPTCPQLIHYDTYDARWSFWKKVILIAFVLFITIGCLVTKCLWIIQHRNLKQTQALYLNANYEGSDLYGKVMCLPTCPPHSAIGISCSELDYDISNFPNYETGTLLRKRKSVAAVDTTKMRVRKRSSYAMNKKIIKGVTAYFNPGQLVAIMGPSGSGKTTLLDVITARKHFEEAESNIFINGLPADETREWFIKNSGYVLQLATPYHEELTVRQNLTYSAMMRLPMKMKMQDKMWRVEQVLGQCGLYDVADVVVGDNSFTGGGLSGGQKRRLCIALQLLDLPSVIFLDEPTSGLDSASSLELLETLHSLTLSGRLVVVTIHQPRIEIFHMFDAILLLCEGQVAYFGSPIIAPTMIAEALKDSGQTFDASNPADSIMDVLTNPEAQKSILDYYLQSGEIQAINRAIARARRHPQKTLSMKFQKQTSSIQNRLLALDGRTSASQTLSQSFYFPLIYLLYGLALGTCYWKTHKGVLLMSCYMVFSCASQLFLASVIHGHLHKAFALFELEKADGIGHSTELILHVFIRTFSKSSIPLIMSCAIIYLCSIQDYVLWKFCLTTLIHLQLNQAWIAIIVFTACCTPRYSTLVSPLLSAVAGFAGGFLVPEPQMPWIYYWLFYINPTHWAYSGMMKVLITDVTFQCKWDSPLECQTTTGIVVLSEFGFSERNPYVSMFILLVMLITFLLASVVVLEIKYSKRKWDKRKKNYWQAITQSIRSCYNSLFENYYRKKREAEEEERNRLFKLVEHQYQYKGEHYAQTPQEGVNEKDGGRPKRPTYEPLKDHSQVDGEWVDRKRSNTVNSNDFNDETYDETENSSNDEDIDPTLELRQPRPKLSFQQNSFTSVLTKLQSGLTSKTNSFDNNNDSPSMNGDTVPFRSSAKKKRQWRKAFAQRRKTFTGFIEEGVEEESKPYSRWRPKSMLLPDRHHDINIDNKLHRTKSNMTEHSKLSRTNTISSSRTTVIERRKSEEQGDPPTASLSIIRRRPQPPDIVIDIERATIPEEAQVLDSQLTPQQTPKVSLISNNQSRPTSRPSSYVSMVKSNNHHKRKKKKDPKAKDTWSKYLDVHPKRHEVYCALNSIKKRLRGSGRGVRGALKKSESVHLQRKASILILDEKKDSMRTQLYGLQRTYTDDSDYSPTTMKRLLLLKSREKFIRKTEQNNAHIDEQPLAPLEETQVVPRSPKRRFTGDRALLERLSALSSQRNSARSSVGTTLSSKRSSKSNSAYNVLDSPVTEMIPVNNQTSAEIYNVLRKLHDIVLTNLKQMILIRIGLNRD
ncbi:uncharacterized protein [Clytia hemisphaerica]|uniref:ABC transporter domain-containing protein n=2 Tax=Clytia hemisphaerica TaxID=252671 RepID=A0A7M5V971_9CNID